MNLWHPLAGALAAALGMMTLVWVASLVKKDASVVDVFWSLGRWWQAGSTSSLRRPTPRGAYWSSVS